MKNTALILFLAFIAMNVHAQLEWNLKGGVAISTVVGKDVPESVQYTFDDREFGPGIYLGFSAAYSMNKRVALQFETQFAQKGWRSSQRNEKFNLNYLDVLPIVSINIIKQINIEIGPSLNLCLSDSPYEDYDYGFITGSKINIGKRFGVILRYYHGLKAISEIDVVDINNNPVGTFTEYNRCFQAGLSYKLN